MNQYKYKVRGLSPKWINLKNGKDNFLCMNIYIDSFVRFINADPYNCGVIPCNLKRPKVGELLEEDSVRVRINPYSAKYWQDRVKEHGLGVPKKLQPDKKFKRTLVPGLMGKSFTHDYYGETIAITIFIEELKAFLADHSSAMGTLPIVSCFRENGNVLFFVDDKRIDYFCKKKLPEGTALEIAGQTFEAPMEVEDDIPF